MHKSLVIIIIIMSFSQSLFAQEFSGYISGETRLFPRKPLDSRQHGSLALSLSIKPELYYDWDNGNQSLLFVPYFRLDQHDKERTHFDIRELFYLYAANTWEISAGIRQVFWGVTESSHLVDIINQTDFVENLDGEQKLGQPMINFTWINNVGVLDLYLLAGFRERTFQGTEGRLRFPLLIDLDKTLYESDSEEKHIDLAARWTQTISDFDLGLSYFYGTSREPRFEMDFSNPQSPTFNPAYDLIHQVGLDAQFTKNAWLLKLETILRWAGDNQFFALTGGVEYTFSNVDNSGIDIGIIAEYLRDDRNQEHFAPNPFNNHTFVGTRLAFNDVQSTDILGGAIINNKTGSAFINLEGGRRLGESLKLKVEVRVFTNVETDEFFYSFRRDGHSRIELEWYF